MKSRLFPCFIAAVFLLACSGNTSKKACLQQDTSNSQPVTDNPQLNQQQTTNNKQQTDPKAILAKKEVPILCYHHFRVQANGKLTDYSVVPERFIAEMKLLADSGYKTILPDQLYNYLVNGTAIPAKPVMITFDDTDEEQFSLGKKEMDKYGFKGVFFIMTISLNRPHYMTNENLKQLVNEGHVIGAHTWDHHMVTKYQGNDWEIQIDKPKKKLEDIIGKPIDYFAYPFGLWNEAAIPELKKRRFKMAFQLSTHRDTTDPLYTIRRIIIDGHWTPDGMLRAMKASFH